MHLLPEGAPFHKLVNSDERISAAFDIEENIRPSQVEWAKYPKTVAERVAKNFKSRPLQGVELFFSSNLPQAAGLSSSSALMILMFAAISKINNLSEFDEYKHTIFNKLDLAEYLGCIENGQTFRNLIGEKGVGTFGGSQDHAAILFCKKNTLSQFRFSPVRLEKEINFPENLCFVVASSGVDAKKTGGAQTKFNRLALQVKEITNLFDTKLTLAEIVEKFGFDEVKAKLKNPELIDRLNQFYTETYLIIPKVAEFLEKGEVEKIGEFIDLSHRNADKYLNNQTVETNFLQNAARRLGAFASSAFGAGFGGSVYALVKKSDAEKFLSEWRKYYLKNFPQHTENSEFFVTSASESEI